MSVRRRTVVFVVLALMVWAVLATGMAGYYYIRLEDVTKAFQEIKGSIIEVDVLIDYGNGTEKWHNHTKLIAGSTTFDALLEVTTDVQYEIHSFGKLITSIDGRKGEENSGWMWYFWNTEKLDWDYSLEAVDQYTLHPADIIKFEFTSW
jgi:hypothetical protein